MKFRIQSLSFLVAILMLAACAGPKGVPDGPLYYVTDGVMHVVYGEKEGQIACAVETDKGSHLKRTNCYTAEEVKQRHFADRRELLRWEQSCPSPSLCKTAR